MAFLRALVALAMSFVPAAAVAQTHHLVDVPPPPGGRILEFHVNDRLIGVGLASLGDSPEPRVFLFDGATSYWIPVERPYSVAINNLGIVAGVRTTDVESQTAVAYFFSAIDGTGYTETALDGCSRGIRRFTDSGILLLASGDSSAGFCAIYRSTVYDLSAFGTAVDVDEDATLAVNSSGGSLLRSLDGSIRRPFPPDARISHFRNGYAVGSASGSGIDSPEMVYARPNGVVSRVQFTHFLSRATNINRSGLVVGTSVGGVRTLLFSPFLYRDGAFQPFQYDDPAVRLTEGLQVTDRGVVVVNGRRGDAPIYSITGFFLLVPTGTLSPPTGVSFALAGRTVTLTWQPSADAVDYIVEAGSAPGSSDFFNAPAGSLPATSGVVPPGRYFVRVRARNASGISAPSREVVIDVP